MGRASIPLRAELAAIASDVERLFERLEERVGELKERMPSLPRVMEVQARGASWFSDGYRCIRDVWPLDYEPNEATPSLEPLLATWDEITEPVTATHFAESPSEGELVRLSHGAWMDRHWWAELTIGRGWTLHGWRPKEAIVLRCREGRLAGGVMPANLSGGEEFLQDVREVKR